MRSTKRGAREWCAAAMLAVVMGIDHGAAQQSTALDARGRQAVVESTVAADAAWKRLRGLPGEMKSLGIDVEAPAALNLGLGVPMFWLSFKDVAAIAGGTATLEQAARNDEVVFPVVNATGAGTTSITMARRPEGWREDALGRPTLARGLVFFRAQDIGRTKLDPSVYFGVEVPSLQRVFLGRGSGDETRLIPLDTEERWKLVAGTPLRVEVVMQALMSIYEARRQQ